MSVPGTHSTTTGFLFPLRSFYSDELPHITEIYLATTFTQSRRALKSRSREVAMSRDDQLDNPIVHEIVSVAEQLQIEFSRLTHRDFLANCQKEYSDISRYFKSWPEAVAAAEKCAWQRQRDRVFQTVSEIERKVTKLPKLTGIGIGPVSASWEVTPTDAEIAQRVLTICEDRRVLFNNADAENPTYCIESVLQLRQKLSEVLQGLPNETGLPQHLRLMADACRTFLDTVGDAPAPNVREYDFSKLWHAVEQLRRTFGVHLSVLVAKYELGIPQQLVGLVRLT
jgi:hypothetical protein